MKYILKPEYREKGAMWILVDGLIWSSCGPNESAAVARLLRNTRVEPVTLTSFPESWEVHPESPNTKFCTRHE